MTQLDPAPPASPATTPSVRRAVFAVTALGSFLAALDLSIVNVAFRDLEASFPETSPAALSWVITAYTIVFGALLVTGGRTGDRLGRRRTFLGGVVVFLLGSVLCGVAPSVPALTAARVLQGVGAAFLLPASVALLIAAHPPERRTQVVALWGGIGALAVATGPSLGAAIVSAGGWRWAFFVNLPVGIAILALGRRVLSESEPDRGTGTPDYLGVGLLSIALASLVLAVSQAGDWGWSDGRTLVAAGLAPLLGTWFVLRSRRHPQPVLDPALFGDPAFVYANAGTMVYAAGFFAMLLANILFLTGVWDYSIMRAGLAVTPGPMVVAVVAGPAGKLAGRIGFRPVLLAGAACFAGGLLWYVAQTGVEPRYLAVWLPGTLVVGLGVGLTFPVLSAAAVSALPPHRFAVGSAVNQTARQVGGSLGIAVLVLLLGDPASAAEALSRHHDIWVFGAVAAIVAGLLGAQIPRPARVEAARAAAEGTAPAVAAPLAVD